MGSFLICFDYSYFRKSRSSNKGDVEVPESEESTDKPETDGESNEVQEVLDGKEIDENVKVFYIQISSFFKYRLVILAYTQALGNRWWW